MQDLDAFVRAECERVGVPGCAVGVVHDGRRAVASYGVTSVEAPLPVDAATLFMIGSTTKTLTATTLMTLVEQGLVGLDDLVVQHLPGLRLADPDVRDRVTVGQLFDHSGGWRGDTEADTGWGDDALARAVDEVLPRLPQLFAPGTFASYNNAALLVAGRLIEQLTGTSYEAAVQERVLAPLGMTSTFFQPWEVATRRFAAGHVVGADDARVAHVWPTSRAIAPAGGAISTVEDQLTYAELHLGGRTGGPTVLSDESRQLMQARRIGMRSMMSGVGLSWLLREQSGVQVVQHGGNCSNLHVSAFALVPEHRFAVTVLTNSRGGSEIGGTITQWAMTEALDLPAVTPPAALPLSAERAREYAGRYDAGQWDLVVTAEGTRLFVQMVLTDVDEHTPEEVLEAFRTPATEVVMVDDDVVAAAATPAASLGDFVRDGSGRISGLRYGMRLALRRPVG